MADNKQRPPSQSDSRNGVAPDYGTAYVPNAGPAHLAPQSLDHFKRGYAERANQRDKEFYTRRHGPTGREKRRANGGNNRGEDRKPPPSRPMMVDGLDINQVIDRLVPLVHSQQAIFKELDTVAQENPSIVGRGKTITLMISVVARRKEIGVGNAIWEWMDARKIEKNTYHYNSMISVTEKTHDFRRALALLDEMSKRGVEKNEVTFSSAISACEKAREWQIAIDLLDSMEKEGIKRTAIAYNATISACEKGMVPQKACDVFQRMKAEGIKPTVVSYSALISAAEKGGQWKLSLQFLEEMKQAGFRGNVVAYSAAISALAKGQEWRQALDLFREIESHGGTPSIVTYNATMTALEKGMQWELALDLFEEMKTKNLPITVVSYGSAISACDKGFQYRQCLEFLDEMSDMGIPKNVIIFGAAMSCMEKCSRADIGFELLKRMRIDGIEPNVHIYNSLISACSRSNLWEKGYALYEEMGRLGIVRDVVTYNAVLDAVASQVKLGRKLFEEGVEKGFYAKVSRLGGQWLELDLHFLSLGGGEIALGWWFEVCLVPYLSDVEKLSAVKTISVVTGYGKTRTRGRRHGDDGMRLRVKTMLKYMKIQESEQPNAGRIHIDKDQLIAEVSRNGGKIVFDLASYVHWKETQTTANVIPDVEQKIRARFKPKKSGSGRPPFVRVETETTSEEYLLKHQRSLVLDQGVRGTDYRADIDYAIRDGIRFEVGGRRTSFDNDDEFQRHAVYVVQPDRSTDHHIHAESQVSRSAGNDLEVNQSTYGPRGRMHEDYEHAPNGHGSQDNRSESMRSSPRAHGYNNNSDNDNNYGRYERHKHGSYGEFQSHNASDAGDSRLCQHISRYPDEEPETQQSDSYRSSDRNSYHHDERKHHSGQTLNERDLDCHRQEHHHRGQQFDDHDRRSNNEGIYQDAGFQHEHRPARDDRHRSGNKGGRNGNSSKYQCRRQQYDYYGPPGAAATVADAVPHHPNAHGKHNSNVDQRGHYHENRRTDQRLDQSQDLSQYEPLNRKRAAEESAARAERRQRHSRGYSMEPPMAQHHRFS